MLTEHSNSTEWVTCVSHAATFPKGWESEHAMGPLATGNGPCVFFEIELTDEQIDAMSRDTHIVTDSVTTTERRDAWVMFNSRRYVATVYDLAIRNRMIESGRADRAIASNTYRHPYGG